MMSRAMMLSCMLIAQVAMLSSLGSAEAQAPAALEPVGRTEPMRPPLGPGADRNDWEAYFDRGAKLFREAPEEASPYLYWASRLDPARAEPYFARWSSYLFRSKNEDVFAYLRSDPALWRRPDFLAADSLRTRALMRNPFVHRGLEALAWDRLPGTYNDGSRDLRAWIAYTEGKFPQAIAMYTRTIERGGARAVWTRYDRALASVAAGDMPAALADLKTLVEELRKRDEKQTLSFYASKHQLLYMIGLIHSQMGNQPASRESFGEAIVEDAAFAYGWAGLAALSRGARQNAQAAGEYEQALLLAPVDGYLHYLQGLTLFDLQRYDGAAQALERAIVLEPHYAPPYYMLGRVRERQGREPEAIPHYERFVQRATVKDPIAKNVRFRLELRAKSEAAKKSATP